MDLAERSAPVAGRATVIHVLAMIHAGADGIAGLRRYEAEVIPILREWGGVLVSAFRPREQPGSDGPAEIHWIEFPSEDAFRGYRDDPRVRALEGLRRAAIAHTAVLVSAEHVAYPPVATARENQFGQPIGAPIDAWSPPARPPREPLLGEFCYLEPLDAVRHGAALYEADALDREGRSWTYLPYGPFETPGAYLGWIEATCRGDDPLFFAVVDAATGRPLGVASYLRIDPRNGSIEVGHIHYSPALQRTRAATEAMYLLMKRAFELGFRRYEWKCDALNAASRVAAQRLGLSYEGVFRQATLYKQRNRDSAWYAAIDADWPDLEAAFRRWLDPANFDTEGRQRQRLSLLTGPLLKRRG